MMIILNTERLMLRRLEPGDLDALYALYRDPEIRRYFPDGTRTFEETKEELEWHQHGPPNFPTLGLWATVDRQSGEFLGRCGLLPWMIDGVPEIELAYLITKERWGQGLATEAAKGIVRYAREQLGLTRLICFISHGNAASARVAEKVGMSYERDYTDEFGPCMIYSVSLAQSESGR